MFRKIVQKLKIKIIYKNTRCPYFLGNATGSTDVFRPKEH